MLFEVLVFWYIFTGVIFLLGEGWKQIKEDWRTYLVIWVLHPFLSVIGIVYLIASFVVSVFKR